MVSVPQGISPVSVCTYSQNMVPHSASSMMSGMPLPLPRMLKFSSNLSGMLNWSSLKNSGNISKVVSSDEETFMW